MFISPRYGGALILFVMLSLVIGCSQAPYPVKGSVTYNGKPVEEGTITFEPADGNGPPLGGAIQNGEYDFIAPIETNNKFIVRILGMRKTGRRIEAGMPAPKGTMVDEVERFIPASYNEKSTLSASLPPANADRIDFNLKGKK